MTVALCGVPGSPLAAFAQPPGDLTQTIHAVVHSREELSAECESLRRQLRMAKVSSNWWWEEVQRLRTEVQRLEERWATVQVTSPLTGQQHWLPKPSSGGWAWRHFETYCPCCKRPVGVTVHRFAEGAQADFQAEGGGAQILDGTALRCKGLPEGWDEMPIFESPRSFEVIGSVAGGGAVVASGPVQAIGSHSMVPVRPRGAVALRFFEAIGHGGASAPKVAPTPGGGGGTVPPTRPAPTPGERAEEAACPAPVPPATRRAYCCVLWGANAGYALGAAVLGRRLRELEAESGGDPGGGSSPDLVLMHTDDVPANFLAALGKVWTLQQIDYIDGVEALYSCKGTAFDGVFTKLAAWGLEGYDKVLLLDIDVIPLRSPRPLFELKPPAALIRGNGDTPQGSAVDGSGFFIGEGQGESCWQQGGGINAGVILLRPCRRTLARMGAEVTAAIHPEHLPGRGPEQDYLTRFFASAPWHSLDVRWNYQIHHVPFAMEKVLDWRRSILRSGGELSAEDRAWRPRRLQTRLEDIGIVHCSGDVKLWHVHLDAAQDSSQRRAVEHVPSAWADDGRFSEHLLRATCEGYERWVERSAPPEDYAHFGCALREGGRVELVAGERPEEVTALIDEAVEKARAVARLATAAWRACAERLLAAELPGLLEELQRPSVPEGSMPPGARVQALWRPPGVPPAAQEDRAAASDGAWLPAKVVSVHADGRHVVRYDQGGTWGDTERGVPRKRLRVAVQEPSI
uniref:Nucleotide-diphospho-sugar transferase domain-containing protein n=1 Tax=Alexandrium monilatum TaxID=311494 RepID=A0A7S4W6J3_9DINO